MYSNKYLGAFLNKISTLVHQNEFQKANFQSFFGESCSQILLIVHALDDDKCILITCTANCMDQLPF